MSIMQVTDATVINAVANYIWAAFERRTSDFERQRNM
jgi:hypothetical protein